MYDDNFSLKTLMHCKSDDKCYQISSFFNSGKGIKDCYKSDCVMHSLQDVYRKVTVTSVCIGGGGHSAA